MTREAMPAGEKAEETAGQAASPVHRVKKAVAETAEQMQKSPFAEMVHKVLLVGLGAGALTVEEAEKFVKRLVERGEIAEADGRKFIQEAIAKRRSEARRAFGGARRAEAEIDRRIEEILGRMNIPTKAEIEALSAKITALAKKVDELKKMQ